jgi:diguanylate cyclase (GGDEF)-like protein/PAS domain S-box-containing protein
MKYNYRNIFENLQDGVYFVDQNRVITYWNKAAEKITGYTAKDVIGSRCMDNILIHINERNESLCMSGCPLAAVMGDGKPRMAEVYLHHKKGHRVPVLVRATALRDEEDRVIGAAEVFSDITPQKEMQERIKELEKLALVDNLTGLSNRKHLEGELEARFQEQYRYGLSFGILFIDIDFFKKVNDTFGHEAGDQALKTVAETFKASTRSYDLFGRWGGEEFLGIIRNVDRAIIGKVAERFRILVEKTSVPTVGNTLSVTVSIGATIATPQDSPVALVQRADELMYQSKQQGRNRVTVDD